jgi:hypothetical protein
MANNQKGGKETPPNKPAAKPGQPNKTNTVAEKNKPISATGRVMTQRQLTRFELERRRSRQLTLAAIGLVVLIVIILGVGIFQSAIAPNIKELATVNGQTVTTGDYYKFRKLTLFKRIAQYQQFAGSLSGDQQQQIQQQISQFNAELDSVQSFPIDQDTLNTYVGILVADKAAKDEFGINPSDDDLKKALDNQLAQELRINTPTPNPFQIVVTPTLAAVETALQIQATATANAITPLPTPTPSVSATASPIPTTTVAVSPTVTATETITPTVTPQPTNIPGDKADQTISASKGSFFDSLKKVTGLSDDDYRKLEVRPKLIKDQVSDKLLAKLSKVGDPALQLQARKLSVKEQVEALAISKQILAVPAAQQLALFEKLVREKSIDTVLAPKNGDLGWFTQYQLSTTATEDLAWDALTKVQPGQITVPVKAVDGWDLYFLIARDDKRPLDERAFKAQFDTDQTGDYRVYVRWLADKTKAANPSYKTSPTPTTEPTQVPPAPFTPVIQPTATPVTSPDTGGTPAGSTVVVGPVPAAVTPTLAATSTATKAATTTVATTTAATTPAPTPTK